MAHEETTAALEKEAREAIGLPDTPKSLLSGNPPQGGASQLGSVPPPRDLAAVIDAMLAEIPESESDLRGNLETSRRMDAMLAAHGVTSRHTENAAIAGALVKYAALGEPWYERVMAIWSGEVHFHGPDCESDGWTADCGDDGSLVGKTVIPYSPTDAANLASESDLSCSDCHGEPEIILITQKAAKCVRCFILAGMKHPCFACGKNPTEAIVRAIHPTDGKDDTVGVCIDCLLKHVSAGRN